MRFHRSITLAATVSGLSAGAWTCPPQEEDLAARESTIEALLQRN